ncbi:MAG: VIT domain-containing protein [Sandaracinaceae bacterium]
MTRAVWAMGVLASVWTSSASAQNAIRIELRAELTVRMEQREAPLPQRRERLRVVVDGQYAETGLTQVFHNPTPDVLEGQYVLRPSLDARVEGFAYYIGEERIVGEVLERQAARRVYRQVTRARRDPAILEQTADGEFTFRVFPIQPAEDKRVDIRFGEWLPRRGRTVDYRAPLRGADAEILIRDARARHLRSPTHELDVEAVSGGFRVRTRARLDDGAELRLRWDIEEPAFTPNVWVHRDEGEEGYFLLSLASPEGYEERTAPKDVTLVLDHSGSMAGEAMLNAQAAAADVVRRLGASDRLNVIGFDDDVRPLFSRPRAADAETRADALEFIARLSAGGGTDIAYALTRALASQHDAAPGPQVLIFVTDGQSAPATALRAAAADRRDCRVFTVGVGGGVNRALLSRLAAVKRGSFTSIADPRRIEAEVGHLYAQIAHPLLVGLSIELEGGTISRTYPRTLSDLFLDDELVVAGRFRGDGPLSFTIRGTLDGEDMALTARASQRVSGPRPWVGRRWAVGRVDHLLENIALDGPEPELTSEVVSLGLAYQLVTPYTAFLAIPERELTAEAAVTLAAGRQQRANAQTRHTDAVAVTQARSMGRTATVAMAPPMDEPDEAEQGAPMAAQETSFHPGAASAGCASCSVGARTRLPHAWLMLVLASVFVFRRSRPRS